jgi:DNA-binding response OmpR family regulator
MAQKTILLVDDSNTLLMMERMILSKGAYRLVTASNGEEAVSKAISEKPDVILMDVVMPRMGGFAACRELRTHQETREVPIIMVTTRGEALDVETGYRSGANDYVTKPINGLELLSKLKNYLGE